MESITSEDALHVDLWIRIDLLFAWMHATSDDRSMVRSY